MCQSLETDLKQQLLKIPLFKEMHLIVFTCNNCGFKLNDFQSIEEGEPIYLEYEVKTTHDLTTKIIRAVSASIEIPEIGTRIDPGIAAIAWVNNIEGVLVDIKERIIGLMADKEMNAASRQAAIERIELINDLIEVKKPFRIRVIDEKGNSGMIPASQENYRELPFEEAILPE